MTRTLWILVIGTLSVIPVAAHHSFASFYFEEQSVTVQGAVVEYQYRNPHTWLMFDVTETNGERHTYSAEWSNPNRLRQQGVTAQTFKPGDVVIVTGSPGRVASEYRLHLKQISRPADGWSWGDQRTRRR